MLANKRFNPKALVGKSLQQGRYVLKHFLGAGSFAYVFKAEEMLGGQRLRDVAVKWIVEGDPASILSEAQALAAMPPHPNIVTFLTSLPLAPPATGLLLVLEFVEGKPLDRLLMEGVALPPEDAGRLLDHVLAGLAHAHAHKVVHRDLKPENILARPDGILKITDFGIARSSQASKKTSEDVIKGTPAYMAPEQFGRRHDHRVDIYAAGVMAYEMLVGRRPFTGTPLEIMRGHVMEAPEIPAHLPAALRDFLDRSLAKNPDDRYATAEEMRRALVAAIAPQPEPTGRRKEPTLSGRATRDLEGRATAQFTGNRKRAHAAATRPAVLESHPDKAPQASVEWRLPPGSRLLASIAGQALPGMTRLAQRVAAGLKVDSAFRHPAYILRRALSYEKRQVVERFDVYRNQRFSKPVFEAASDIDPWEPMFGVERPTGDKRLTELRIPSTERQMKCLHCRGRGRAKCAACNGEDSVLCDVCKGSAESECADCQGMGDRVGYLVIEAHWETQHAVNVLKPPPVDADVTVEDLADAPAERLMRLNGGVLAVTDLPSPFPWPDLLPPIRSLLESITIIGDSASVDDDLTVDFVWIGHAICELKGEEASVDAVPEGGFATCEPRLLDILRDRAFGMLRDVEFWDNEPMEALSLAREALGPEGPPDWRDPVQETALGLVQRLLAAGHTGRFRDLRRPFSELVGLDSTNRWKQRWADVIVAYRRALMQEVQTALEGDDPADTLARALTQMSDLEMLAQEGPALFKLALERLQDLLRKGQFERSDRLIDALRGVTWPVKGAIETLAGLKSGALQERCMTVQRQCDTGGKPDAIYREISSLLMLCPEISLMAATLRAFRKRLGQELKAGRIVAGCHWGRRLQEELSHARPDLAPLFASMLDGHEDEFITTVVDMVKDPARFGDALSLLGLQEVKLEEDPRVSTLAAAFDSAFTAKLAGFEPTGAGGALSDEQQQELTREMGAWMRLQGWCSRQKLPQTFVGPLWNALRSVLQGQMYDRIQPLLDLADQVRGIGDDPQVGPLINASREVNFQRLAKEAIAALGEKGDFDHFQKTFGLLLPLVPKHPAVSELLAAFQVHLVALALEGRAREVESRAERLQAILKTQKMHELPWLRDPVSNLNKELEKFVLQRSSDAEHVRAALETIAWLRSRKFRWAEELVIRLDQALDRSPDKNALMHRLAQIPVELVVAATDPHTQVRKRALYARASLDSALWRWGMLALVPMAGYLWPWLVRAAGVPVPGQAPVTRHAAAAWAIAAVAALMFGRWISAAARFVMARRDPRGRRWRAYALGCGALFSMFAFAAVAFALRMAGGRL
ncbi:MAG: serine/threonine protein kinase [Candidatus Wallbacteria bacterium]|nr:serine/threonine protein kinase [Candidatus Wallbacteria bacterium]